MAPAAPTLSEALARFSISEDIWARAGAARQVLALSLLDWFAVAVAGAGEPVAGILRDMVAGEAGRAEASVIGLSGRLPARAAALANGATSHALDYDDTHFLHIGHPSVAVLPAALALAERTGADGRHVLEAALVGVETSCRIGDWLGRRHYDHGFHQTATAGAFGATLAGARLLGLDAAGAAQALGIAATRASGLKSQFGTMGKPYNAGIAAANGVEAALLAAAGFVSRSDGLDCAQGFGPTHAGEMRKPADVLAGLGERFVFCDVSHKFHACCHGLHAAIEALGALGRARSIVPGDVRAITIRTHPSWLKVCDIAAPETGLEAKFSYRLAAAMVLAGRDTAALATYDAAACRDPDLVALRDRVTVVGDPALADTVANVELALASGGVAEAAHDLAAPMTLAAREAKIRAKAAVLIGARRADALWRAIGELESAGSAAITELFLIAAGNGPHRQG